MKRGSNLAWLEYWLVTPEVAGSNPVSPENINLIFVTFFYTEYFPIFIFLVFSTVLACVIFGLSYVVSTHAADAEKLSTYECGFDPYEDSRNTFDVRFYLVAILFIIFDLEVSFLFPWSMTLGVISAYGFWTMAIFLLILTVGFVYEWKKGALEWE
jgi:NADH:ubiquinone oxidoreductase subunit 3 (subunit A)